jgi:dolichyl-diphosphooligosaccharide--protein glycosyltransferase
MPITDQYQKHFFCNVPGKPPGYDRVRNAEIGNKDFELDVMEEAYTTEHWIVRIYKVKDLPNRGVR